MAEAPSTLAKARALIESAEKARIAIMTADVTRPPPHDLIEFWKLGTEFKTVAIAEALVEAVDLLRDALDRLYLHERDAETTTLRNVCDGFRSFLSKHADTPEADSDE